MKRLPRHEWETGEFEPLRYCDPDDVARVEDQLEEAREIALGLVAWWAALPLDERLHDHDAALELVRRARALLRR